ncbi:MAG: hypothetical protein BroJett031_14690 [Betaproteobacteria bacterium]|nr:MAG: hypothetical protein BroJett031_14690 [Betaproteobacteria bacterium]
MRPGVFVMNALLRSGSVALLALMFAVAAHAQPRKPLDAPPRLPAADAKDAQKERQVIRLPESERAPQRAREDQPLTEPAPEDQLPPAVQTSPEVRIEQRRQANRVVEVIVTPAGSTTSYVIVNREGARTLSQQELSAGLSVPRFLRLEF